MSHEYTIGVRDPRLGEEEATIPSIVPGNEALQRDVQRGRLRQPTSDEANRAILFELLRRQRRWLTLKDLLQ